MTKARIPWPIAGWLRAYQPAWLRVDIVAGLTAAAVVIPKAMACAVIAGLPVEAGLYTALAAMLVYPLLGTSRPLSVTTTSAIAMLTAAQVAAICTGRSNVNAMAVAAMLALLVGGILIVARLLRLGFLANFISKPVLVGFEAGVGVVILVGQLKSVLGVHVVSKTTLGTLLELPGLLPHVHGATALTGLAGIAVLLAVPRFWPRVPASLVWVALSIAASAVFGLEAMGVTSVGAVPSGLPSLALPDLALAGLLWPAALGIALMSFIEAGYRLGQAALRRADGERVPPVSSMAGAILGLLAFMLAFTFGMVASRYDARKALVRDEANAIRTAWLRSDFLTEPNRGAAAGLLRDYVDHTAIAGSRRSWASPILAPSFSIVIALIASLDRPLSDFVKVSQQPLVDLRSSMAAGTGTDSSGGEQR